MAFVHAVGTDEEQRRILHMRLPLQVLLQLRQMRLSFLLEM